MSQSSLLDWIMALAGNWDAILQPILERFALINDKLDLIIQQGAKEMAILDDLTAQVAQNASVEGSAVQLIQNIAAQLAAAGTDPAKLQDLQNQLKTSSDALAAAVAANTPAPPPQP